MSRTIEELQEYILELQKRLKVISSSYDLHKTLHELKDYFSGILNFLQQIKQMLDENNTEHQEIMQNLSNLSNLIQQIQNRVLALENAETEVDLSGVESDINLLEQALQNLIDGSDKTMSDLQREIEELQGNLDDTIEDLQDINSSINTINNSVGSMQTNITNLANAQNTLTSTQNALGLTVNLINTRLTGVENNIGAISGGVDLSELSGRVDEMNNLLLWPQGYAKKTYYYSCRTMNNTIVTNYLSFFCGLNRQVFVKFKFNYTVSNPSNNPKMTLIITSNSSSSTQKTINLSTYSTSYEFAKSYLPCNRQQNYKFTFTTSEDVLLKTIEMEVSGVGIELFDEFKALDIKCAGNKICIIKRDDTLRYYKVIDKSALTDSSIRSGFNTALYPTDGFGNYYTRYEFAPYSYSQNGEILDWAFGVIKTTSDNVTTLEPLVANNSQYSFFNTTTIPSFRQSNIAGMMYDEIWFTNVAKSSINADLQCAKMSDMGTIYSYYVDSNQMDAQHKKYWFFIRAIENNNLDVGSSVLTTNKIMCVGLNQDGYMYFFKSHAGGRALKLCKGLFATGYLEQDGTINIYVSDNYNTKKIKIQETNGVYEIVSSTNLDGYSVVYETYDNKIVYFSPSANAWYVTSLAY